MISSKTLRAWLVAVSFASAALLLSMAVASCSSPHTQTAALGEVHEGVYFRAAWWGVIIVQLQDGRFQYWLKSDVGTEDHTNEMFRTSFAKYPVSGLYETSGGTVSFQYTKASIVSVTRPELNTYLISTQKWLSVRDGKSFGLCSPEEWRRWKQGQTNRPLWLLRPTSRNPEELFTNWCHEPVLRN